MTVEQRSWGFVVTGGGEQEEGCAPKAEPYVPIEMTEYYMKRLLDLTRGTKVTREQVTTFFDRSHPELRILKSCISFFAALDKYCRLYPDHYSLFTDKIISSNGTFYSPMQQEQDMQDKKREQKGRTPRVPNPARRT